MRKNTIALVQQSNSLIESSQKLNLVERRLIYHVLSIFNPKEPQRTWEIRVKDFAQFFPNMGEKTIYEQLKNSVFGLMNKKIQLLTDKGTTRIFNWLSMQEYKDREGYLTMTLNDLIIPLISDLHREYTTLQLKYLNQINSAHAMRIYELCSQYKIAKERVISIEDLKFFLSLEDKYNEFKALNKWVIKPTIDEINAKTDLFVKVEYLRTSRTITDLKFIIFEKDKHTQNELKSLDKPVKRLPKQPPMPRHPNPRNLKKYYAGEYFDEELFEYDKFKWALEGYKRLFWYEKECKKQGFELPKELIEKRNYYTQHIGAIYSSSKKNKDQIEKFDELKKQYNCIGNII